MNGRHAVLTLAMTCALSLTPVAAEAVGMIDGPISVTPLLTTFGDPSSYTVNGVNEQFSGVAKLLISSSIGTGGCSGSLIGNGGFVLTAAHCVADGGPGITATSLQIQFSAAPGSPTISMGTAALAGSIFLPTGSDGWTGAFEDGADLALIKLPSKVAATSYDIVRDTGVGLGSVVTLAGYGRSGSGLQGDAPIGFGTLRTGTNVYDAFWAGFKGKPFAFDFDDGTSATDTIGLTLNTWQPGTGASEVFIAPGDSGGPTFLNGKLIGVHSFGGTWGAPFDVNRMLDSSFGELGGDTSVAFYAGWIDSVISPVSEARTHVLMVMGLLGVLISVRRRADGGWRTLMFPATVESLDLCRNQSAKMSPVDSDARRFATALPLNTRPVVHPRHQASWCQRGIMPWGNCFTFAIRQYRQDGGFLVLRKSVKAVVPHMQWAANGAERGAQPISWMRGFLKVMGRERGYLLWNSTGAYWRPHISRLAIIEYLPPEWCNRLCRRFWVARMLPIHAIVFRGWVRVGEGEQKSTQEIIDRTWPGARQEFEH